MATKRVPKLTPLQACLLAEKARLGTYAKLARHLGFSVSQVHGWATGDEPTVRNLRKIAERLDRDVVTLIEAA